MLDRTRVRQAFELLGADLAAREIFLELAVYGGTALMLQFEWRRTTEDVDAVVREGYNEKVLGPSVDQVGRQMGLPPGWLNNAVGMFTPLQEGEDLFTLAGNYPSSSQPGLRVLVAKPRYLLAMKLRALANLGRGDRDLSDARALARELNVVNTDDLRRLYVSIHAEDPRDDVARHFPAVVERS